MMANRRENINDLPSDWRLCRLGDLATYHNGRAFKPEEWQKEGRPIIRIENLNSQDAFFNCFDGDVRQENRVDDRDLLVSWSASLDAYMWDRGPAVLNQHIFKVEENKDIVLRRFLYYLLRHTMTTIRARIHGATMQHITKPKFESIEVAVPSLEEQGLMVKALDEQMAAAERARKAAEERLESASALTDSYVRQLFDSDECCSWARAELLELCEKPGQYGTSQKSYTEREGIPILGMYNIHEGRVRWENVSYVPLEDREIEKYLLRRGDILFNRTNSAELVGKTAVYDLEQEAVFASYLVRFHLDSDLADPYFICAYINSHHGRAFIERNMSRAIGQANISASTMHKMSIPVPSLDVQREKGQWLRELQEELTDLHESITQEIEAIDAMPSAILRQAFAGSLEN